MNPDLILAKEFFYDALGFPISHFEEEPESKAYSASTFLLNDISVKFRVAKITPAKAGAFVTLWKRSEGGITCPHEDCDPFHLYIISVRNDNSFGQFVFPKSALIKQGILSSTEKEGKRGFRVYAPWDKAENKQALQTQTWQSEFFVDLSDLNNLDEAQIKKLYSKPDQITLL
jgi:hypothetical protein